MRWVVLAVALSVGGCETKDVSASPPTYAGEVGELLLLACGECHGDVDPEAGYSVTTYYGAIGCTSDGRVATDPRDASAPILAVLARADHASFLDGAGAALVARWVETGATDRYGAAHLPGFTDPRSTSFHGAVLRASSYEPMYDAESAGACGRCHDGAPARAPGVGVAPGAPACTDCHDRPAGVLDCATCHGRDERAHPPRDACYFGPEEGEGAAHAAHADAGVGCATCHGARDDQVGRGGVHGNGNVEIALDALAGGEGATYDVDARTCAVYCHARGGERPMPAWVDDGPLDCQSCHTSPPAGHYPGTCDRCHAEANAEGTALLPGPLHVNGVVDVGDGGTGCGSCHGAGGDDAWPRTGSHDGHRAPTVTTETPCADCHPVPMNIDDAGHLDATVQVALGGRAAARGVTPSYDAAVGGTCVVACHGAGIDGGAVPMPRWRLPAEVAGRCDACHGVPPASSHPVPGSCASILCHGGEIGETPGGPRITETGRLVHIDGVIDVGGGG